ncbi:MAG: 50S ribosomal protein L34e [Zestosphaera sp.]
MSGASIRSRSLKKGWRRTPGGRSVVHYKRSKSYIAVCGICGQELGGVPKSSYTLKKNVKSSRRPERFFGGVLCPSCLSLALKLAVRSS